MSVKHRERCTELADGERGRGRSIQVMRSWSAITRLSDICVRVWV